MAKKNAPVRTSMGVKRNTPSRMLPIITRARVCADGRAMRCSMACSFATVDRCIYMNAARGDRDTLAHQRAASLVEAARVFLPNIRNGLRISLEARRELRGYTATTETTTRIQQC